MSNVFIELTNPIHGGEEWSFGKALWSPTKAKNGHDRYKTMRDVKPGDIIIHSLSIKNKPHTLVGVSEAASAAQIIDEEPLFPGRWSKEKGYNAYYRIKLKNYSAFKKNLSVKQFLTEYQFSLTQHNGSFFNRNFGLNEGYLFKVEKDEYEYILEYLKSYDVDNIFDEIDIEDDSEQNNGSSKPPGRVVVTSQRIIRDTKIVRELKEKYDNRCQICGEKIVLSNGKGYSEGHHIQPLGYEHQGPDIKSNIIIVCPNHHVEFDYGIIAIDPSTYLIKHASKTNIFNNKKLAYERDNLDNDYLKYHYKNIYKK